MTDYLGADLRPDFDSSRMSFREYLWEDLISLTGFYLSVNMQILFYSEREAVALRQVWRLVSRSVEERFSWELVIL